MTGGKFTIEGPDNVKDQESYHCKAENDIGAVLSNEATILFGCTYAYIERTLLSTPIYFDDSYLLIAFDIMSS